MEELAAPAIEVVERDEVRIVPDNYKRVYLDWMRSIRPWCVSRQLWWGHQIPVWYGPDGEEIVAESEELAAAAARERGIDPDALRRETDVLDTWFSSALWPFATLGWPDETPLFAGLLPDQLPDHRARDHLPLGRADGDDGDRVRRRHPVPRRLRPPGRPGAATGAGCRSRSAPGSTRSTRSTSTAPTRCASGCSRCHRPRTSATRPTAIQQGRDLANKMWNASRLILLNAGARRGAEGRARPATLEDRWILSRLQRAIGAFSERHRLLRLRPRGARLLRVLLVGALRLVPGDRQAAPLRRRRGRRGEPALRARAGARARASGDAVRHRGDLELPARTARRR